MQESTDKNTLPPTENPIGNSPSIQYDSQIQTNTNQEISNNNDQLGNTTQSVEDNNQQEIHDTDILSPLHYVTQNSNLTTNQSLPPFLSTQTTNQNGIYMPTYQQPNQHLPFYFGQPANAVGVGVSSNQQYLSAMLLPSVQPTSSSGGLPVSEMEPVPSNSTIQQRPNDHQMNINSMDIIDEANMNIPTNTQTDANLVETLPENADHAHHETYDYTTELKNNYSTISHDHENIVTIRFRKNNCSDWNYMLNEKQSVKIRIAMQENQLFFDLDDILTNVCGLELTYGKLHNFCKGLTMWVDKVYASQYGDLAFEKEEIFVTYYGLCKLTKSRLSGGTRGRKQYQMTLNLFVDRLTKLMIDSFGHDCLLNTTFNIKSTIPISSSSSLDAIIRAWKYYRMLIDRLEEMYTKEKNSNPLTATNENINQLFEHNSTQNELEMSSESEDPHSILSQEGTLSKHIRLNNENINNSALANQETEANQTLLTPQPTVQSSGIIDNHAIDQSLDAHETEANQLGLIMQGTPNSLLEFSMNSTLPRGQRDQHHQSFDTSIYDPIINEGNENTGFIDENSNIMSVMVHHDNPSQSAHSHETIESEEEPHSGETLVWTSDLISNSQSTCKKGKRCPVCSHRCGNSSKKCSVCHTPFKTMEPNVKRYKCTYEGCNACFRFESQLLAHICTHEHIKRFVCPICQKRFGSASNLHCHIRIHNNVKPYVCDVEGCHKAFRTTSQLKQHKLLHTGELPYKCTFPGCTASFRSKRMLEPHLRSHTNEPSPHKCLVPGCGKVFAYRSGLLAHIKAVHDHKLPIKCPYKNCDAHFLTNSQLQEHYERVHCNGAPLAQQQQIFDPNHLPSAIPAMQLSTMPMDPINKPIISTVPQQQLILTPIADDINTQQK